MPRLPRRLVLALRPVQQSVSAETAMTAAPRAAFVDFVAFAQDATLSGRVEMTADRLTDLLNGHEEYVLRDVVVNGFASDVGYEFHELAVPRDDLFLVQATGPRGDARRRTRTRQHPIALKAGPYEVHGYLHALPGADPIAGFRRRPKFVPLTDARITLKAGSWDMSRRVSTLLVNRDQVDWIAEASDEEIQFPDLPAPTEVGIAKDFTGAMFVDPDSMIRSG